MGCRGMFQVGRIYTPMSNINKSNSVENYNIHHVLKKWILILNNMGEDPDTINNCSAETEVLFKL